MRIIGYAYSADLHCPECAYNDAAVGIITRKPPLQSGTDQHGLAFDLVDREGNHVHPVFSTDERPDYSRCCCDCGASMEGGAA